MRLVIQRVREAKVEVNEEVTGAIKTGLLLFVGVEEADDSDDVEWLCRKVVNIRPALVPNAFYFRAL